MLASLWCHGSMFISSGNAKWNSQFWKTVWHFFIKLSLPLAYDPAMISFSIYLSESRSVVSNCLRPHGLYSSWNSPGENTGVGRCSLLQGIFPTQGLNPGLPHFRRILQQLSHQGSPRILEGVAYPISSRSSQPRNQTSVSCIAGVFFTN